MRHPEDARGELEAHVPLEPAGPGRYPHQTQGFGRSLGHDAGLLEAGQHRGGAQEHPDRVAHVGHGLAQALQELRGPGGLQVERRPPRTHPAPPEPAAAGQRGQVQEIAAETAAEGGGGKETHVAAQCPEVAGVVGEPLELQRYAAQNRTPGRRPAVGQSLDRPAVGRGVGHAGVSGRGLHEMDGARPRAADKRALDPTVLIAQGYLQMEHVLAVALEPEMPGLDDPRVHGPHRHLVYPVPLHLEIIGDAGGQGPAVRRQAPAIGAVEADGLEPRVTFGPRAPLFRDLPLEPMGLRAIGGQRRVGVARVGGGDGELPGVPVRRDGEKPDPVSHGVAEEAGQPPTLADVAEQVTVELPQR